MGVCTFYPSRKFHNFVEVIGYSFKYFGLSPHVCVGSWRGLVSARVSIQVLIALKETSNLLCVDNCPASGNGSQHNVHEKWRLQKLQNRHNELSFALPFKTLVVGIQGLNSVRLHLNTQVIAAEFMK